MKPQQNTNSQKIKVKISYDGTDFKGWQKQNSGVRTVQGCLEEALSKMLNEPVITIGSGRTDSGVHAREQFFHFSTLKNLENYKWVYALNSLTPKDIAIHGAWKAPQEFHALASCERKIYKYFIFNSPTPNAFRARYSYWAPHHRLDLKLLNNYSQTLLGTHDFKSFQTQGTEVKSTQRHIYRAEWRQIRPCWLEFTIEGNGFLKQMVRNIIGSQLDLERQRLPTQEFSRILKACRREQALGTASPEGLYLYRVQYPHFLDKKCLKI